MGLTTESLHIRTNSISKEAIEKIVAKEGFEPCADESAQRTVILMQDGGWTTVLDSMIFQGWPLAKFLSKGTEAIGFRVEDSDKAQVAMWNDGKKTKVPAAISDLLKGKALFAEARLAAVAREFGIDPHHCTCVLEDLLSSPEVQRLSFRSGVEIPTGPPVFQVIFPLHAHPMQPGGALEPLSFTVRNNGANAKGVRIRLGGEVLPLIRVDRVGLMRSSKAKLPEMQNLELTDGLVEAPDFLLPGMPKFTGKAANSVAMVNAAFHSSMLTVRLAGKALEAGRGQLEVTIEPLENPDGAAVGVAELKIGG